MQIVLAIFTGIFGFVSGLSIRFIDNWKKKKDRKKMLRKGLLLEIGQSLHRLNHNQESFEVYARVPPQADFYKSQNDNLGLLNFKELVPVFSYYRTVSALKELDKNMLENDEYSYKTKCLLLISLRKSGEKAMENLSKNLDKKEINELQGEYWEYSLEELIDNSS